ncbi:MAG TPA: hypothetical protein DEQ32_01825 [Gammaproteobacteria bacterium]|nr:hypothetical protein [Gammaproteobacteria bacterium]
MRRFQDRVDYALAGRVAVVTLDRPDRLNAFDGAMYEGVNEAMLYFRDDADAWVAVLQASGERAFSAGADVRALDEHARSGQTSALGALLIDSEMVTDKPIIAAVHGHCVGEGVNLALACDLIFADSDARFMISEVRIGVNPVDIPIKLANRLGYAKAFAFLAPGDGKSSDWLASAGLVERVCPAGTVRDKALEFATRLVEECAPLALRAQKDTLFQAAFASVSEAKASGETRRQVIRASDDYAEGRQAFLEKRTPKFTGR